MAQPSVVRIHLPPPLLSYLIMLLKLTFKIKLLLYPQNSKLKTQNSKLKTQNSKLKTQNSLFFT
jgi:hypothetical protein